MNTNLLLQLNIPPNGSVLHGNTQYIGFLFLVMICIVTFITLAGMLCTLFIIEHDKYQYRKYIKAKEDALARENLIKRTYTQIRNKYSGQQLEFSFVKAIDDEYISARYNLNSDVNE